MQQQPVNSNPIAEALELEKKKREKEAWEQTQNDKYDDRRIR